ncbi:unnamed protein product [Linum tenue]|uniref:SWIM-type domain-containing protein n=1 Tax=Linum tenue TaxID=586396 RepID=A0AAV0PLM4_9ROSI|nr:unnamed protein product [Linum tenue]
MYFRKLAGHGDEAWRLLCDDKAVIELVNEYKGKEEYHVYIQQSFSVHSSIQDANDHVTTIEGESTKNPKTGATESIGDEVTVANSEEDVWHDEEIDEFDSDFEVNPDWVSDEDVEDREQIAIKLKMAKENLKRGIPITYHSDEEVERRQEMIVEVDGGFDSDEMGSHDGTDVEDEVADHGVCRKSNFPKFNPNLDTPFFEVGMIFNTMDEAREAITKYSLNAKKDLRVKKCDTKRVRMVCTYSGCPFVLLISWSKVANAFQIKTLKQHRCGIHFKCRKLSPVTIAKRYHRRIRTDPRWKLRDMVETIREELGYDVDVNKCSRAKRLVLHLTEGCYRDEYAILWTYAEEIRKSNVNSTVRIMVNRDNPEGKPKFCRMYVCFGAMKMGFLSGCRKVIALDGCFLKGLCKGELLAAVGRDANDQMYPIAWAVVEVESRSSWDWFLKELKDDLCIEEGVGWCFSSDQMKGLVPAIADLFPSAEHRLCARHIWCNWRKKYKRRDWQTTFWECAKASTPAFFSRAYEKLLAQNEEAAKALVSIDPKHWSRAYFSTEVKCDSVDNNMSESFNASILEARFKAIYSMLDDLRTMMMTMIAMKKAQAEKWGRQFCPKILKKFEANAEKSKSCHITHNGKHGYEVRHWDERFTVSIPSRTCSCRVWELTGIPCPHAITCLAYEGEEPEEYISDCFKTQKWRDIYANVLQPMDGPRTWIRSEYEAILPPDFRVMPGRPKKKRVKTVEEMEDKKRPRKKRVYTSKQLLARDKRDPDKLGRNGRVIQCKNCKEKGHNSRTCKKSKPAEADGGASSRRSSSKGKGPAVGVGTCYKANKCFGVLNPALIGKRMPEIPREG